VSSATIAQKELVEKGRATKQQSVYRRDPAWAKGLITAAQSVAGSVKDLVSGANNASQGKAEEEVLIAAAKGVAASTARLVYASRAKADQNSQTQQKLTAAARAVAGSTAQLVQAAQSVTHPTTEAASVDWETNTGEAANRKIEMEQRVKILQLEKDLQNAQTRLGEIRKQEYKDVNPNAGIINALPSSKPARSLSSTKIEKPIVKGATSAKKGKNIPPGAQFFSLAELQTKPQGVDTTKLELYLSDEEFMTVFGMDKPQFAQLTEWKRTDIKQKHGLH